MIETPIYTYYTYLYMLYGPTWSNMGWLAESTAKKHLQCSIQHILRRSQRLQAQLSRVVVRKTLQQVESPYWPREREVELGADSLSLWNIKVWLGVIESGGFTINWQKTDKHMYESFAVSMAVKL
jgi:hypothetical protein